MSYCVLVNGVQRKSVLQFAIQASGKLKLQYSSQIVETGAICLEFSPNFLHSLFTPLFSLKCAPLLPQRWAECILEHWNDCKPKSTLGRGKSHKCFKICDEHCSLYFWPRVILTGLKKNLMIRIDYSSSVLWIPPKTLMLVCWIN